MEETRPSVTVSAPAKINLFLHVTGRRPDGYHLLESLFTFTRMGDRITVAAANRLTLDLCGPHAARLKALGADGADNLVCRAAVALAAAAGLAANIQITLEKNLPVEAGIGGGSSDAAAVLLALNHFWGLDWPLAKLEAIALPLGADIPACLHGRPVLVRGIGEVIAPASLPWHAAILLVNPGSGSSTPAVFHAYKESGAAFDPPVEDANAVCAHLEILGSHTRNSLFPAAAGLVPAIDDCLADIRQTEGALMARMSGSGATCFGLYRHRAEAETAATALSARHPGWWVMVDDLVSGH